jgi:hypothetical protein
LAVSAAASPTNSVPIKENEEVTKTLQKPLKPLFVAPGFVQYCPPIYPLVGGPPILMTIPSSLKYSLVEGTISRKG